MIATVSSAYTAPWSSSGSNFSSRHARTLHVAPEVADYLNLGSGALRLDDGAPLRTTALPRTSLRKARHLDGGAPVIVMSSNKAPADREDDDDDGATRSSVETQRTLVGSDSTAANKFDAKSSQSSSLPSSSSSSAATQSRRIHAAPLNVSADVQAILAGRMRGGGALSLGGEPLRATAKGDVNKVVKSGTSDRHTSNTSSDDSQKQQKGGKYDFLRSWK